MVLQWKQVSAILMGAALFVSCGCGGQNAQRQEAPAAQVEQAPAPSEKNEGKGAEAKPAELVSSHVLAEEDFSNLRLTDAAVPIYDKYTLAERRAKGLPVTLPQMSHYREKKMAYLTFDDGPDDINTPAILDILKKEQVKATFYVLGRAAEAYPDIAKRIFAEGHAIGNHSYDHDYGKLYASVDNYLDEMEQTDEILHRMLGMRPLITRAPGGRMGNFTDAYIEGIRANGYVEHDWNVSSADTAPGNPVAQDFMDNIEEQATMESAIILMHSSSGHEETVKALPGIIRILREKGYNFGVITPMTPQPW